MKKFKVSINDIPNKVEPCNAAMKVYDTYIADNAELVKRDNIRTFVERVGSKGHTFCPSTFKNGVKSRETFEQSQLFVLYFDSLENKNTSFEKMKARASQYDLPVLFAYDVFSPYRLYYGATRKKFVIAFLNAVSTVKLKEAEAMQKALMTIFPEADKSSSVLKLYKGGNQLLYFDDAIPTINADWLFMNMSLFLRDTYGSTNYKRKIAEFSRATGMSLNNKKLPDISVVEDHAEIIIENEVNKNSPFTTMINEVLGEKLSDLKYTINFVDHEGRCEKFSSQKNTSIHRSYRSDIFKTLSSSCQLYQEFESGTIKLSTHELLGLATNLAQVESGASKFKATLSINSYFDGHKEYYDNWDYYFYYIKDQNPRPCTSFCPHHNTCPHGKNILSTAKPKHNQIERITNQETLLVGLDEAWDDFKENFNKAVLSNKKIWHVINCQTALGKTQAILELLKNTSLRVLVAVPTNKLKREVYERAKEMGIDIIVSPSLHELKDDLPDVVWDQIAALYDAGKSPMPRLNKAIAEDDLECAKLFKQYKSELDEFINFDGHAITTHRRLTGMDVSKYDLVIIDEDIIYSTVIPSRDTNNISELKKLKKELAASDPLTAKITKILKMIKRSEYFTLNEIDYDRAYADIKMAVNIPTLCSATYFCYRKPSAWENDLEEDCISFIKPVKFPKDTKYIMLSATANKDVCEYCFREDNVKFYGCKEAKLTGTLNQFGDKSMGRNSMAEDISIISKIKKWSGFDDTISFKKFLKHYAGDMYFGNCAGCDYLKGKNLDVIGTPHQPEWIYKLFAYSLGFDIDAKLKPNLTVTHNGCRFRFRTYEDQTLRAIQFYMIESELEQAVGRARLLRYDCTVNLFSNFPLRQAVLKESEYDVD